jgi:hypothetical protein
VLRSRITKVAKITKRILTIGYEEPCGNGLENPRDRGPEELSVEWVKYLGICETRSTAGMSDPGGHATEIPKFREKCIRRKQRRRLKYC